MRKRLTVGLGVLALLAVGATAGSAAPGPSKCASSKLKATGKKAQCLLGIDAKAAAKNLPPDSLKVQGCKDKFSAAFVKTDAKSTDCIAGTGDANAIESKTDTFADNENSAIALSPPSKCQSALLKNAGKKAKCLLGVYAKGVSKGVDPDATKLQTCKDKFSAAAAKAAGGTDCGAAPSGNSIESDVDAYVNDVLTELTTGGASSCAEIVVGQPIPGTYVLNGDAGSKICTTNAASNRFGSCTTDSDCGGTAGACLQLPWVTADGQIMPFPTAVQTTFTVAAAGSFPTCEHQVCVPCGNPHASCAGIPGCEVAGNPNGCIPRATQGCCDQPGFLVPTFFVNILGGLCSRVDQFDCGIGVINTSNPQTGDNEVTKNADTSDPGPDCLYGTGDDPAPLACTTAGAGNDYKGKIVSTIGNGSPDTPGIHYRLTTPEMSTTWQDAQSPAGTCANGSKYDDGELLVSQLLLQAQPTTAGASGSFVDMNGDGCKRAGAGFISSSAPGTDGPITVNPTTLGGPLRPQSYDGMTAAISAAVSEVFSGPNSPIRDIGFVAITPQQPIAKNPSVTACSCTPVAGCPE